jgi:L-rhamnonate dehydratase
MLNDLMWLSSKWHGSSGLSSVAQSAIDLALWDLKGKLLGQPVWRLIGGPARDRIHCYATSDDPTWARDLGFDAFKIGNPAYFEDGNAGLDRVESAVGEARATVGDAAELMLNVTMSYDVSFTVQVAERIRPFRLSWLEEPLPPDDIDAHSQLRHAVPWLRLATGEDHHTRVPFRQLVEHRAVDVLQPDLFYCGGLTEALKIYAIAEAAGIPTTPHYAANTPFGQHFAFAMPTCYIAEFFLMGKKDVPIEMWDHIPGLVLPKNGYVAPSDAPGFGLEIPPDWIVPYGGREAGLSTL